MANYVDYDYWVQGYGDGDLSQPDRYVVVNYWTDGYAEYETVESSVAFIDCTATVTANGAKVYLGTASVTSNAQVESNAIRVRSLIALVNANATVTANGATAIGGNASITSNASFSALGGVSYSGNASIDVTSILNVINVSGYEWVDITTEPDNWGNVSPNSNIWETQLPETNTWARQ
jgi:hypothetical protein